MLPELHELVQELNSSKWRRRRAFESADEVLVKSHAEAARPILRDIIEQQQCSVEEAYDVVLMMEEGQAENYGPVLRTAMREIDFRGAGAREGMVFMICACYCWPYNKELCTYPNPWPPIIELMRAGFSLSYYGESSEDEVVMLIGLRSGFVERVVASIADLRLGE